MNNPTSSTVSDNPTSTVAIPSEILESQNPASSTVSDNPTSTVSTISKAFESQNPTSSTVSDNPTSTVATTWTPVKELNASYDGKNVKIRGRVAKKPRLVRGENNHVVLLIRDGCFLVQCTVESEAPMNCAAKLTIESVVDVEGIVSLTEKPVMTATQQMVEVKVTAISCLSPAKKLPFSLEDASGESKTRVPVGTATRMDCRVLDLRTPCNQGIFSIKNQIEKIFSTFLWDNDFKKIHTPRLIYGSSTGGAAVFKLNYKKQPACLAQSTQIHKQIVLCGDFNRIFEISPVFRAEDSNTPRHLCEYTALDVEMQLFTDYFEVMDVVDKLFVTIFDAVNQNCKRELEAINKQYPFQPLKYLSSAPRIKYIDGVQMLMEAGVHVDNLGDLSNAAEKKLGELVLDRYGTDFFILYEYPLRTRPFFTMPTHEGSDYSNAFDCFLRGQEIISGGQRINDPDILEQRALTCKVNVDEMAYFFNSFRYGAVPRGGFGAGLERVVMQFCGLDSIRKTSLFPRYPGRIKP